MESGSLQHLEKCDSCLEHDSCTSDFKDQTTCELWHTKIIELYDGDKMAFQCVPNKTQSSWHLRLEIGQPETLQAVAKELHVKPKTVLVLLVGDQDRIPRPRLPETFPSFDLNDEEPIDKAEIRYRVSQSLMENHHLLAFIDQPDELFLYDEKLGIYEPGKGRVLVADAVRRALEKYSTSYDVNETEAIIHDAKVTNRKILEHDEPLICVQNGILNIYSLELTPHTPNRVFLSRLPVAYEPTATCPNIDAFLNTIVAPDDVQTLTEEAGYSLDSSYYIHKAFLLNGEGNNGKTTWLNVLKAFFGPENCAHLSLQELENNRFAKASLVGKMVNIYPDLSAAALSHTGVFKMLVGGDPITCEYKFGKHFNHQPQTKHFFGANVLPESPDDTTAFFRRWIITNFCKVFSNFSEPKADPHILEKLTTPSELSGLLNKALKGLRDLRKRGYIWGDQPSSVWREEYIRKSDPIAAFVMDCLTETTDENSVLPKAEMYRSFVYYCSKKKLPVSDSAVFSRKIKSHLERAQESTHETKEGRQKVWRFIEWTETWQKIWKDQGKTENQAGLGDFA